MKNLEQVGGVSKLLRERYASKVDEKGFVYVREFAIQELRRQLKNIASFLDGDEGTNPDINLGTGLKFTGSSGNYSDMKIHIDDVDEFVRRVKYYYGE